MIKKWLAILGVVVLIVCTFQLLWGTGGSGSGEEYPWGSVAGGGNNSGTGNTAINTRTSSPLRQIYIVRPAPMGGFYLIRVSLPSDASAKAVVSGGKKAGN